MSIQSVDLEQPTCNNGHCHLRMYRPRIGVVVAIFSELPDNPGMSITNDIVHLATALRREYLQQGEALFVIEHREADTLVSRDGDDDYTLVQLMWHAGQQRYHTPTWGSRTKAQVEAMIGEPL